MASRDRIEGVLLGTAMGDALGLPFEGLAPQRIARRLARRPLPHGLVAGRGMISDDSEHAAMVAEALLVSTEPERFASALASRMRRWLGALPPGVGLATARGILRSCVGLSPARSGVHSAGNGPAMRSALLGLVARDDAELVALVRASTRITHSDPRAEQGARLVARWARDADSATTEALIDQIADIDDPQFRAALERGAAAAADELELDELRERCGWTRGVSGFIVETLAAVTYCWLRYRDDPSAALESAIRLGGDTDTVAAIVGALVGARVGASGLPASWCASIYDWPLNPARMHELASALTGGPPPRRLRAPWLGSLARNMALLVIVIAHLLARALGR